MNKRPFRWGTGVLGLGTGESYMEVLCCCAMNKQPFRLGTGGTGVLGVGTGDWGPIHGNVIQ